MQGKFWRATVLQVSAWIDRSLHRSGSDHRGRLGLVGAPSRAIGLLTDVSRSLNVASKSFMVDILHLSPPCQPYSPAHTTSPNIERDEQNQAVLFSTWQMVDRLKPRVVTMEETEGLYKRRPRCCTCQRCTGPMGPALFAQRLFSVYKTIPRHLPSFTILHT